MLLLLLLLETLFLKHQQRLAIELSIALAHQFLEGHEVLHRHDLVYYFLVDGVGACLFASHEELLLRDFQLGEQTADEFLDEVFELVVDGCVL